MDFTGSGRIRYDAKAADIWSLGIILFILVAGCPPLKHSLSGDWWFDRLKAKDHANFWLAHEQKIKFSSEFKDLINQMLSVLASDRITIGDIMKHPWVRATSPHPSEVTKELELRHARIMKVKREKALEAAKKRAAAESTAAPMDGSADDMFGDVTRSSMGSVAQLLQPR